MLGEAADLESFLLPEHGQDFQMWYERFLKQQKPQQYEYEELLITNR